MLYTESPVVGDIAYNLKIFMTQIFKVLKDFELDNEQVRSGQEVVCRAREAEKLVKEGFVAPVQRELDPADKKDAALIAKSDARAGKRHDGIVSDQEAREESKNEREAEKDAKHTERVTVAKELAAKVGRTEEGLEKEIEAMSAAVVPEKEEKEATAPVDETKPAEPEKPKESTTKR